LVALDNSWFELKVYIPTRHNSEGNMPWLMVAILFMFKVAEILTRAQIFENPKSLVISPKPQHKAEILASKPNNYTRTIG